MIVEGIRMILSGMGLIKKKQQDFRSGMGLIGAKT